MSALTAFGRSVPSTLDVPSRISAEKQRMRALKAQWLANDARAGKNGPCKAVYWVKEREQKEEDISSPLRRFQNVPTHKQWVTGAVYKGEWSNNAKSGYGVQIYSDGAKYEGEWSAGKRHGHGTQWKPIKKSNTNNSPSTNKSSSSSSAPPALRRVYVGTWANDVFSGSGVYYYSDGSRYEGEWSVGRRDGFGTLYKGGDVRTGEWRSGEMNGFGTWLRENKDIYEGEWRNGKREGSGLYYYKDREMIYDGEWVSDAPKAGVYCAAKEFFDDVAESAKLSSFSAALNNYKQSFSEAIRQAQASELSPRFPLAHENAPLPRLRLADHEALLTQQITNIQNDRAAARNMAFTQISDLFSASSLSALHNLFSTHVASHNKSRKYTLLKDSSSDSVGVAGDDAQPSGFDIVRLPPMTVPAASLHAMLHELGFTALPAAELQQLLHDLNKVEKTVDAIERTQQMIAQHKTSVTYKPEEVLNFEQFVRAVYLVEQSKQIKSDTSSSSTQ